MGALFPVGLRLLAEADQSTIPWSWAVNGVAAVVGGVGAKFLAISFGYHTVMWFAISCYILAALSSGCLALHLTGTRKEA
jgi:hypothetical protein